jgi:hypothetical protein
VYLGVDPGQPWPLVLVGPGDCASFKVVGTERSRGELGRTLGDPDRTAGLPAMLEDAGCNVCQDGSGVVRADGERPLGEPGPG